MSDYWWPRTIKPLTNKTYNMSRGSNVLPTAVQGGIARQALRYTREPVPFTLNFIVSDNGYRALLQFYDVVINHGANSFKMMLDSGTGIVEHQVFIVPNTFKASKPNYNVWHISLTAVAIVTPSQDDEDTSIYDIWN